MTDQLMNYQNGGDWYEAYQESEQKLEYIT